MKMYDFDAKALARLCRDFDETNGELPCPANECPFNKLCEEITEDDWKKTLCQEKNNEVFNYSAHRDVWDYLANHPGMIKVEALEKLGYDNDIENQCFACEYVKNTTDLVSSSPKFCDYCPLEWDLPCYDSRGLYHRWLDAGGNQRVKLAEQIRDLNVKMWVKYD